MKRSTQSDLVKINEFSGILEAVACPICVSPPSPQLVFSSSNGIGFWHCPECDIQYASPRFTEESLLEIYENEAFTDLSFYDGWSYDRWKKENKNRSYITQVLKLQILNRIVSENDRILDVGCGTGLFCLEASRHGQRAEGIEPSIMLVDIGRKVLNLDLHQGLLEDFDPGHRYKAIVVWDVLEHVYNPVELVKRCNYLLEEGGYLFAQVPNYDGISNRFKTFLCKKGLKKTDFKHFGFPWHIFSFNKKSLATLLRAGGFTPVLFESWSHMLKDGAESLLSRFIISVSRRFHLSDYITCLAQKQINRS